MTHQRDGWARRAAPRLLLATIAAVALLSSAQAARAADACDPKDDLVALPYVERLAPCLAWLRDELGRGEAVDRVFARRIVERALKPRRTDREANAPLELVPVATAVDVAVLLGDDPLQDDVVAFVLATAGPGREERERGLAHLYVLRTPRLLSLLGSLGQRDPKAQGALLAALGRGLPSLFWPHLSQSNAGRLIVGGHWELAAEDHPQHGAAKQVEDAVRAVLE